MASWPEIERFRKSADECRALAARLLKIPDSELTEWERLFLDGIVLKIGVEQFSTRQAEKLLQIRDDTQLVETIDSFSVAILLRKVHAARLDLSESDEDWIVALYDPNRNTIKRRNAGRLKALARTLNLIDA